MRVVRQEKFGGPEVLRLATAERPAPMGTEVLVRVRAAGVNPVDWVTRAGDGYLTSFPMTVGWDISGVVEEAGLGVTRFAPGDEVFGMPWFPREAAAVAPGQRVLITGAAGGVGHLAVQIAKTR
jgi:NADPH:quinone reductase-like Zn-dependent oxidoreductase